ncbi:hypothetical protein RF11_16341 [Thelohanellus kitauei]|uniref:Uncharacterized protein n=1 Tax=Thelohanellus kitauei TaxID=669202 RepID=A0A0C2MBK3_THEKT|nr:hypothetical protein RF11_16341 [Thelohanellus kitauei]
MKHKNLVNLFRSYSIWIIFVRNSKKDNVPAHHLPDISTVRFDINIKTFQSTIYTSLQLLHWKGTNNVIVLISDNTNLGLSIKKKRIFVSRDQGKTYVVRTYIIDGKPIYVDQFIPTKDVLIGISDRTCQNDDYDTWYVPRYYYSCFNGKQVSYLKKKPSSLFLDNRTLVLPYIEQCQGIHEDFQRYKKKSYHSTADDRDGAFDDILRIDAAL